ncbi:WD40 repeat domain-containing protein [Nannocystis radixulma]|uniref:WD40 repeat domain-containing protein n=1 Tax=Nannocystis radixulma TaxID=2995305 RepID=A0ABT5BE88_9BACT|nr:hypothetical protein [Nannocystis radixulma]MDC0672469.1 hypothetical protein [Nannocystis radixulma]
MSIASIAALESALTAGSLESWLRCVPAKAVRSRLRHGLKLERSLIAEYPDSLGSLLLAWTFGDEACAALHAAWLREVEERGRPWIRPLQALPVPEELIAERRAGPGLSFGGLSLPHFAAEDEVVLTAPRLHPSVQRPEKRRAELVRWKWKLGEAVVEKEPQEDGSPPAYPRIEQDGWGPSYLIRSPGAPRVALPCPEEGTADAKFSADCSRLIVWGSLDEYAGGFVWIVDPATLAVVRKLDTDSPVSRVHEGGGDTMVVTTYRSGTIAWIRGRARQIPLFADNLCVSPSGKYVATFDSSLRIWSLAALVRRRAAPPEPGFGSQFDPTGDRLLRGAELLDGHTGRLVTKLVLEMGHYLEGGPAQPSLHFGTRHLICTHGGLQVWDTRSGEPVELAEAPSLSQWHSLAYDREGARLAVLCKGENTVAVHALPSGQCVRTLEFTSAGSLLAMSPDGGMIAMQKDGLVEVRTAEGELVRRCGQANEKAKRDMTPYWDPVPRFSADCRRIARRVKGEGWRIWDLASGEEQGVGEEIEAVADFAPPSPPDWKLAFGRWSVFTHVPTGVKIALPIAGYWACNPGNPRIVVCGEMLAELRAGHQASPTTA